MCCQCDLPCLHAIHVVHANCKFLEEESRETDLVNLLRNAEKAAVLVLRVDRGFWTIDTLLHESSIDQRRIRL